MNLKLDIWKQKLIHAPQVSKYVAFKNNYAKTYWIHAKKEAIHA